MPDQSIIQELVRTTDLLSQDMSKSSVSKSIVEQAVDVTRSEIGALYLIPDRGNESSEKFPLLHKRGRYPVPEELKSTSSTVEFLLESNEVLVVNTRSLVYFQDIILCPEMKSGMAVLLSNQSIGLGLLFLNSKNENHYGTNRFSFFDSFSRMASGLLRNIDLFQELKDKLKEIEALERYQSSIFSSLSTLLITLDKNGTIKYFNPIAGESLGLSIDDIGVYFKDRFGAQLGKRILSQIDKVNETGKLVMGLEGIFQDDHQEMDYSLNIAPLVTSRGRREGLSLLFSDQTRERKLKNQMENAVEDRRVVKDMFSRYLSAEIVHQLVENPGSVRLGGEKKDATIFFADICGYTSFSEGREPEYIVEILNEFFSVSLEIVIRYNGYIDKLIGDCIMAAFGVPMGKGNDDAVNAVSCAVEIQDLVKDKNRKFFTGEASHLKISIGMNSGPVVVGNLGSSRRMDYSVISDTVNVAARLEGVAGADDIIISSATRDLIGDRFKLKELPPVTVKGKGKPIPIFNVLGIKR